ncbi:MAG: abortive phage infection protein [Clostridia bacterium]|jgi:predicted transcriptional regulator of viral defense system|nr:abortive phage infection protein [Clostridia bacterium]
MDDIQKVEKLLRKNNGIIETYQVEELGINNKVLTRMIEKGLIERVARGIYIGTDTLEDSYFITQVICKKGIFSHETALYFHDLCDRTPMKYQLTIPSFYNTKLLKDKNYQFFYLKDELYEIGITEMKTPYGNKVKIYDLERTICDIIRNKKKIEIALFTDSMKRYVERKDRNSIKLHKYAQLFNIENEVRKYLEVLL